MTTTTTTPKPGDRVRCYGQLMDGVPDGTIGTYVRATTSTIPGNQHHVDMGPEYGGERGWARVEPVPTTTDRVLDQLRVAASDRREWATNLRESVVKLREDADALDARAAEHDADADAYEAMLAAATSTTPATPTEPDVRTARLVVEVPRVHVSVADDDLARDVAKALRSQRGKFPSGTTVTGA